MVYYRDFAPDTWLAETRFEGNELGWRGEAGNEGVGRLGGGIDRINGRGLPYSTTLRGDVRCQSDFELEVAGSAQTIPRPARTVDRNLQPDPSSLQDEFNRPHYQTLACLANIRGSLRDKPFYPWISDGLLQRFRPCYGAGRSTH